MIFFGFVENGEIVPVKEDPGLTKTVGVQTEAVKNKVVPRR